MFPSEKGIFSDRDSFMRDIGRGYRSELFTDVTFVLSDGFNIATNRFMLACRSDYFSAMLFGGLKEGSCDKVDLKCDSKIFRLILDYVWEGRVNYSQLSIRSLLDLMENARMMCLEGLATSIEDNLKDLLRCKEIDIEEMLAMLEFCVGNKFEDLGKQVLKSLDFNIEHLECRGEFYDLSESSIIAILKYEERISPEIDVFNVLVSWIGSKATLASCIKEKMLSLVNLNIIGRSDLLNVVRKTAYYDDKAICDALEKQSELERCAAQIWPQSNMNVCLAKNGAKLVEGYVTCEGCCLRDPPHYYTFSSGFTYAVESDPRITVELKEEYMINRIEFLLWDKEARSCSYVLESSLDGVTWSSLLDCREFDCKSTQTIFFGARPMKFISVKGTLNRLSPVLLIVSFSATLDSTTSESDRKNTGMKPLGE